jgi:predicted DNA-binding transcriptional regulator
MNESNLVHTKLALLGFTKQEISIYLELLKQPSTHTRLSDLTGINRTTLYRIVRKLEKRGMLYERIDDKGKFIVANDPSTLEVEVIEREEHIKQQRIALNKLLPHLELIRKGYNADFAIHIYEGANGFKRMLWHELKATGEILCIGGENLEILGIDHNWAEEHRNRTIMKGCTIREIANSNIIVSTDINIFLKKHFQLRIIPSTIMPINHLTVIYNDTVAIYNVYEGRAMGIEIISKMYAQSMRHIFEMLWAQAKYPS